jgi:hypothetical protein
MFWFFFILFGLSLLFSGPGAAARVSVLLVICGVTAYTLGLQVENALHARQHEAHEVHEAKAIRPAAKPSHPRRHTSHSASAMRNSGHSL